MKFRTRHHLGISLLSGIILNLSLSLLGQSDDVRFNHISIEQGLSQSSVYSLNQDNKGFLWFGTTAGLNKYDGYNFTIYAPEKGNPASLSNHWVYAIYEDHYGVLWVGTDDGLNKFDCEKEIFYRYYHKPGDASSLANDRVFAIYEDHSGALWVGTGGGLSRLDRKNNTFSHYTNDPNNPNSLSNNVISAIYEDSFGVLWIGTVGGGLNKLYNRKKQFIHFTRKPRDRYSISNNNIRCIYEDHLGVLWVGTDNGLNKFDRKREKFTRYRNSWKRPYSISNNKIKCIYEDHTGTLWIGTEDGLNKFDRENKYFLRYKHDPDDPYSLANNSVLSIFEDQLGVIWIGTYTGGLNMLDLEKKKFNNYSSDLDDDVQFVNNGIRAIYEDEEQVLWIGSDGAGFLKYNRSTGEKVYFRHNPKDTFSLQSDKVFKFLKDTVGRMWIGTMGGGFCQFIPEQNMFITYKNNPKDSNSLSSNMVRTLLEDRSGDFWIGTDGKGLNKFDREKGSFTRFIHDPSDPYHSLSNNRIFALYEDRSSVLWVGTFGGGLNKFDPENNQFTQYRSKSDDLNSLSNDYVLSIHEDKKGILWIGSNGGGLCRFDRKNESFSCFLKKDGMPDNTVYDILEDDEGNLWLSTNIGISKFNPEDSTFRNFDVQDGLQANEFNTGGALKTRAEEMFFGGIAGFNSFYPHEIIDNPRIPLISIIDFKLFNKSVPIGKGKNGRTILQKSITETDAIELSYGDDVFSFEFSALSYVSPEKNQYAYILEGFEKEWNYIGNRRFASYTSIPPGNYTFKVKGSNKDGVWNNEGAEIQIKIIPPFWLTWWFYILISLLVIASLTILYRNRVKQLKRQREEGERQRMLNIFSQALEQGNTAVYKRRFGANEYEYMGAGIKDITGYDPHEVSYETFNDIIIYAENKGALGNMTYEEAGKQFRNGKIDRWLSDLQIKTKSGKIHWVMDMCTVLRDESDGHYGCLGILFDITDRKLAEEELARTSKELSLKNEEMAADLNMAREVQLAFLEKHPDFFPQNSSPEASAIEFNHRYLPATTLAGDFFDILSISDHQVGVLICDVMGHGARASLLTAYLQGLIEELMPIAADPGAFMRKLNYGLNSIMAQFYTGIFATVFYLVADLKTGKLYCTDAGHPGPLLIRRSKGTLENIRNKMKRPEPALGLLEDFPYTSFIYPIKNDDIVLLYTDGIYEVESTGGELFGKERLFRSVQNQSDLHPDKLLEGVIRDINGFSMSSEFKDDVCMVTMHVKKAKI